MLEKNSKTSGDYIVKVDDCAPEVSFLNVVIGRKKLKCFDEDESNVFIVNLFNKQSLISNSVCGGGELLIKDDIESASIALKCKLLTLSSPQSDNGEGIKKNKMNDANKINYFENTVCGTVNLSNQARKKNDKSQLTDVSDIFATDFLYKKLTTLVEESASRSETVRNSLTSTQQYIKNVKMPVPVDKKIMNLDYHFNSWYGDHSVKVSIPTESSRDGNITMLPSDMRVADALSKNTEYTLRRMPYLLAPQEDGGERESQQNQEEDE